MRRSRTAAAGLCLALLAAAAVPATGVAQDPSGATSRAIVDVATAAPPAGRSASALERWRASRARSADRLTAVSERNDLEAVARIPEIGQLVIDLGNESIDDLRARLADDPRVLSVHADRPAELRYAPNDPAFTRADPNAPFGDLGQWNLVLSHAPEAWGMSRGAGAEVAIVDSGADTAHPDLAPRVAATLNCVRNTDEERPQCAGSDVGDTTGHGTHVAGMACGASDNNQGIASMGFGCDLFIAEIYWCSAVAEAIVTAANRRSDAINLSLGSCPPDLGDAIDYAWARGSVPVAAGTNTPAPGGSNYPAQAVQPEGSGPVIGSGKGLVVTAAKYSGQRAEFAQKSSGVSIAAFGSASDQKSCGPQGILSTWPAGVTDTDVACLSVIPPAPVRTTVDGSDRFAYLVGTSMATPQVAGLVALIRSVKPALPAAKVVRLIKLTASGHGKYVNGLGWGLIDAEGAVAAALGKDIVAPRSRVKRARRGRLLLKSSDDPGPDELPASGIRSVSVFASVKGGRFHKIGKSSGRFLRFRGKPGRRYRFYSVAVDKAGNREARPARPDASLRTRRKQR